jgi:hypothetical protein
VRCRQLFAFLFVSLHRNYRLPSHLFSPGCLVFNLRVGFLLERKTLPTFLPDSYTTAHLTLFASLLTILEHLSASGAWYTTRGSRCTVMTAGSEAYGVVLSFWNSWIHATSFSSACFANLRVLSISLLGFLGEFKFDCPCSFYSKFLLKILPSTSCP